MTQKTHKESKNQKLEKRNVDCNYLAPRGDTISISIKV